MPGSRTISEEMLSYQQSREPSTEDMIHRYRVKVGGHGPDRPRVHRRIATEILWVVPFSRTVITTTLTGNPPAGTVMAAKLKFSE